MEIVRSKNLVTVALALLSIVLFCMRPVDDHDLFLWLSLGRIQLEQGIFASESLNYQLAGTQGNLHGWLWNLFLYKLYATVGFSGLRIFYSAVFALTLIFPLLLFISNKEVLARSDRAAMVDTWILCIIALTIFTSIRPHLNSFFLFSLIYFIVFRWPISWRKWVCIFLTILLWQNLRMSSFLALPLLGAGFLADWRSSQSTVKSFWFYSSLCLSGLVIFFTIPMGTEIISFARYNMEVSRDFLGIGEWYAIWEYRLAAFHGFWFAILLAWPVLLWKRQSVQAVEWMLICFYFGLACYSARLIPYWLIISIPVMCRVLSDLYSTSRILTPGVLLFRVARAFRIGLFCLLAAFGLLYSLARPLLASHYPLRCVQELKQSGEGKKVYSFGLWSGLVGFYTYPEQQVAIDRRLYAFTREQLAYDRDLLAGKIDPADINSDIIMMPTDEAALLIKRLDQASNWQQLAKFSEENCVIYSKKGN